MFGLGKPVRPKAVAFDIIGTVFPLGPLRAGIVALGFPPSGLEAWFAAGLRDAFALSAAGDFKPFTSVLDEALVQVLAEQRIGASVDQRTALLEQMTTLPARSDAVQAFSLLRDAGIPILALSNGSASATKSLLKGADLRDLVEHVVSVDEVKLFKPRAEVYEHAAKTAGVKPGELALVAAHGWDVNGAKAAGMTTAYLASERPFPATMRAPDIEGGTLRELAEALSAL